MKTPNTPTETIATEAVALDRKERMLDGFAILLSGTCMLHCLAKQWSMQVPESKIAKPSSIRSFLSSATASVAMVSVGVLGVFIRRRVIPQDDPDCLIFCGTRSRDLSSENFRRISIIGRYF